MARSRVIRNLLWLMILLAAAAGIYRYGGLQPLLSPWFGSLSGSEKKLSPGDYQFHKVTRRDIRQTVLATGTVTLKTGAEVKIGARISGQLEKLNVRIGDFVKAGQVIAIIEHNDLLARVAQRQAELQSKEAQLAKTRAEGPLEISKARAEMDELQVQLRLSEKMLARNRELNREGVVSNTALDQAVENMEVLKAKIKVSGQELQLIEARLEHDIKLGEAAVAKARADLMEVQTQLSYATIRASIDGIVAFISTQEGETVVAGLSAPTFVTLIDLRKLEVTVFVDETDIGRVRLKQKAVFTVDSYPEKLFAGVVGDIHPKAVIKDNVVNYEVILEIDKKEIRFLRPEMTANVVITTGIRKDVLAIPKGSVKRSGQKRFVVVKSGERLEEKPVELGWREGKYIEVQSGLRETDEVGVLVKPRVESKPRRRR